jgi:hypothetical protein
MLLENSVLLTDILICLGIEKYLLENDHICPSCQMEDVSPASIVINKHLRQVW